MQLRAPYKFEIATRPSNGEKTAVVFHETGSLHQEATAWMQFMTKQGKSSNTILSYGRKIAAYLSWCTDSGVVWRTVGLDDLASWKSFLTNVPYDEKSPPRYRSPGTVEVWLTAVVEFYRWATTMGVVEVGITGQLTRRKFIPASTRNGLSKGVYREVKVPELQARKKSNKPPEWVEKQDQRVALLEAALNPRDRFIVDVLYSSGVRVGELLSLFRANMHLLASNVEYGCPLEGPHIHVEQNDVQNGARAKSGPRWIPVHDFVAQSYANYLHDRFMRLDDDTNPHVLVNLYADPVGEAMNYHGVYDIFLNLSQSLGFRVRPHMLRHTRATIWKRGLEGKTLDADVIQVLLGHASIFSTSIYTHSTAEDLRDAVSSSRLAIARFIDE